MNPETIRQLDGPALTRLAFELGLAPEGTELVNPGGHYEYAFRGTWWHPHDYLALADAVLRDLRAEGYHTGVSGNSGGGVVLRLFAHFEEIEIEVSVVQDGTAEVVACEGRRLEPQATPTEV